MGFIKKSRKEEKETENKIEALKKKAVELGEIQKNLKNVKIPKNKDSRQRLLEKKKIAEREGRELKFYEWGLRRNEATRKYWENQLSYYDVMGNCLVEEVEALEDKEIDGNDPELRAMLNEISDTIGKYMEEAKVILDTIHENAEEFNSMHKDFKEYEDWALLPVEDVQEMHNHFQKLLDGVKKGEIPTKDKKKSVQHIDRLISEIDKMLEEEKA